MRETALQTSRLMEDGGRCSKRQSREFPAACEEDHGGVGCPPAAHGKPTQKQVYGRTCSLWVPTLDQSVPEGLYAVIRTHTGAVLEGLGNNLRAAAIISSGGKVSTTSNPRLLKVTV